MPNAAPVFESALVTLALHRALREKQQLHSVNLKATPEVLKIVGKMEQNPLLHELMDKVSAKELTEVYAAGMSPVKSKLGAPTLASQTRRRKAMAQQAPKM